MIPCRIKCSTKKPQHIYDFDRGMFENLKFSINNLTEQEQI